MRGGGKREGGMNGRFWEKAFDYIVPYVVVYGCLH